MCSMRAITVHFQTMLENDSDLLGTILEADISNATEPNHIAKNLMWAGSSCDCLCVLSISAWWLGFRTVPVLEPTSGSSQ